MSGTKTVLTLLTLGLLAMPVHGQAKRSDSVVKAEAKANQPNNAGQQTVTVTLTIDRGWHTYAHTVPQDFPGIPTSVAVSAKTPPKEVKIDYPKGKTIKDTVLGNYNVYEDKAVIKINLQRTLGDNSPLKLSLKIQACNDKQCLLPATVELSVP
jgi:DsbC/DsbD-like thiol-disulfide interchange protein